MSVWGWRITIHRVQSDNLAVLKRIWDVKLGTQLHLFGHTGTHIFKHTNMNTSPKCPGVDKIEWTLRENWTELIAKTRGSHLQLLAHVSVMFVQTNLLCLQIKLLYVFMFSCQCSLSWDFFDWRTKYLVSFCEQCTCSMGTDDSKFCKLSVLALKLKVPMSSFYFTYGMMLMW